MRWALRRLYYRQRDFHAANGGYAATLDVLGGADIRIDGLEFQPRLAATPSTYEITAPGFRDAVVHINHEGRVWLSPLRKR